MNRNLVLPPFSGRLIYISLIISAKKEGWKKKHHRPLQNSPNSGVLMGDANKMTSWEHSYIANPVTLTSLFMLGDFKDNHPQLC